MVCDMTYFRMNSGANEYRPYVPRVNNSSTVVKSQPQQVENKIINLCRCACRKVEVITGGLNAA